MQKCFYCKSYEGVGAIIYSRKTRKMDMYISFVQSVVCFLGIIMFIFSQKSGFVLFCFVLISLGHRNQEMCTSYFLLGCDVIYPQNLSY